MKQNKGILFVAHGSPNEEANDFIIDLAQKLNHQLKIEVTAAFLNGNPISIDEGFKRLLNKGIKTIDVFPYFLTPGGHTQKDIPAIVEKLRGLHPNIHVNLLEPIGLQHSLFELILKALSQSIPK